ncbi:MAG: ABC transporter ATP-binding protein, partial [Spirochaetaceae bacterium]
APAAPPAALVVDTVRHAYGDTIALDGVCLRVAQGELFSLVGPDGAGKTTLLRILAEVITPTSGAVRWGTEADVKSGRAARGYLSQGFSLYQDLTVRENIEFFAEIYGVADLKSRTRDILSFVGLLRFQTRLAGRLSGGMKKKLALACALVHRPRVLLLDEPTTGVDPVSRRDFWVLLRRLLGEGITIVISTPYLDEAERCMRVGLLSKGRFLAVDTPGAVKKQIKGTVLEVVADDRRAAYRALLSEGAFDPPRVQPFGDRLHLISLRQEEGAAADEVREVLARHGVPLRSVHAVQTSLENAFISLVSARRGQWGQ